MQKLRSLIENSKPGKLAVIGFPYDDNSSFLRGAALAPPVIRAALRSDSSNLWAERGVDFGASDIWVDAGDLGFTSAAAAFSEIEQAVELLLDRSMRPISLGGDHSITYPIIKAFSRRHTRLSILHFDAHPDLYDELQGNRFSHASPFARIMEEGLAARLVQVGVRTINGHQRKQAKRFGVEVHEMKDWRGSIDLKLESPVYISFDLDGLDPAFAPGVSHHEPGGLSTREAISLIHSVKAKIVGADIVEFNPARDPQGITAMVSAKLFKEIAAQMLSGYEA